MKVVLRSLPEKLSGRTRLTVCINDRGQNAITVSCGPRGGSDLERTLSEEIDRRGLKIEVQTIRCLGLCDKGPNVRLVPGNNWFHEVGSGDVSELIDLTMEHMGLSRTV